MVELMKFTARDHAFVYGTIAQAVFSLYPDATDAIVEGIKTYGLQRGARMAQTAACFGDENTMQNYLVYGEWAPAVGEMNIDIPERSPSAVWHVKKCPWQQEWDEKNMMDAGKLYCAYVDAELVHGFNSQLELGIGATQTSGHDYCYFKWTGADMNPENVKINNKKKEKVGDVRLKTWGYHMAHIYKTMGEFLQKNLGEEACQNVYKLVDGKIEQRYGKATVELMHVGLVLDYWITPSCKSVGRLSELF